MKSHGAARRLVCTWAQRTCRAAATRASSCLLAASSMPPAGKLGHVAVAAAASMPCSMAASAKLQALSMPTASCGLLIQPPPTRLPPGRAVLKLAVAAARGAAAASAVWRLKEALGLLVGWTFRKCSRTPAQQGGEGAVRSLWMEAACMCDPARSALPGGIRSAPSTKHSPCSPYCMVARTRCLCTRHQGQRSVGCQAHNRLNAPRRSKRRLGALLSAMGTQQQLQRGCGCALGLSSASMDGAHLKMEDGG